MPITRLASVLRSGRIAPALALVGATAGLAACGAGDGAGTIPPQSADAMIEQLDRVQSNVEDGNCSLAAGAVSQLSQQVNLLPIQVGTKTKDELRRLVGNLGELVNDPTQCKEPDTGPSDETSVATTSSTTTPPPTSTTTSTTTTTSSQPPDQPPNEGGNGPPGPEGNPSHEADSGGTEG